MLTKNNIKNFESTLLNIGDEITYRSDRNQKIESVLETVTKKSPQKDPNAGMPTFDDFLNQDDNEEMKVPSALEQEPLSPEEKNQKNKQALGNIFDEVFEDEGISIDDIASSESTDNSITEETINDESTTEETIDENINTETPPPLPQEDTLESLLENNEPPIEPPIVQDIATIEEVIDDIEDIENVLDDFDEEEDDSEFVLPTAFLINEDTEYGDDTPAVQTEEDDFSLEELLGESDSLFDIDQSDDDIDDDDISQAYSTEQSIKREEEKYRSDREFVKEDETLFFERIDNYNIYLAQAIVELLENNEYEDDAERVVDLILDNANPQIIHHEVEKILKREVTLFENNNVYNIEDITDYFNTMSEQVKAAANIVVTKVMPVVIILAIMTFYSLFFVYKPVKATLLYIQGYTLLEEDEFEKSEELFVKATNLWRMKYYFFKFADLYEEKRYYTQVQKKYDQIIFGMNPDVNILLQDFFQNDKLFIPFTINEKSYIPENLLDYDKETFLKMIEFEIYKNANFDKAQLYFKVWIEKYDSDKEILIKFADMNLVIYDTLGDKIYLDEARFLYDKLNVITGNTDESLLLRARWAIRAEDDQYLNDIVEGILTTGKSFKIPEHLLIPYKEIVEYRLRKNTYNYTADILDIMSKQYPDYIETPYLYALYYSLVPDYKARKEMLLLGIHNFSNAQSLTKTQKEKYIDMRIRLAELYLYDENNIHAARESITKAQILFEQDENKHTNINIDLYRLYFIASQIELLRGDITLADNYLQKSYKNNYDSVDMQYHMGLLSFLQKDWSVASRIFSNIITENKIDLLNNEDYQKVLYLAIANSLIMQKNYVVAIMYYSQLLDLLNKENKSDVTLFEIDLNNDIGIASLQEKKVEIENNIGVALYYLSKQKLQTFENNEALLALQNSNTVFQNLNRDADTLVRRNIIGVSGGNIRNIISDNTDDLIIYSNISYYLNNKNYWQANQRNNKALPIN